MDFADDVAYSVHDVEDGVVAERIELTALADTGLRREVWETTRDWYAPTLTSRSSMKRSVGSRLGRLAHDAVRRQPATSRRTEEPHQPADQPVLHRGPGRGRRRGTARPTSSATAGPCRCRWRPATRSSSLKGIAAQLVMNAEGRVELMSAQRELLTELVHGLWDRGPQALEPVFRHDFEAAADDAARRRVVVDQVASLTDPSAVEKHRKVCRATA